MSFELREISQHDGEPIECYHFNYLGTEYTYTSANVAVTILVLDGSSVTFTPRYIKRSKFSNSDDINKVSVDIHLAYDDPVYRLFLQWMEGYVFLDIYKYHYEDNSAHPYWRGRILSAKLKNNEAILRGESSFTTIKKPGLKRIFQRICNHTLFDEFCRLDKDSFIVNGTVASVSNNAVEVSEAAGYSNGYFVNGILKYGHERRMIMTHSGSNLTINGAFSNTPIVGNTIILYPGCDKNFYTCRNRFNNELNFGGFPHIPLKNPFRVSLR